MKPYRKERIGNKTRSRYEINGSEKELSRKFFGLKDMELSEVLVTFEPEEMMPHEKVKVCSKDEFEKTTKDKRISSVNYTGRYNGHDLRVCIDYGLSLLNISSDNEQINEDIKSALGK